MLVIVGRYGKAVRTWKVSHLAETWSGKADPDSRVLYLMILEETRSHVHVWRDCHDMKVDLHYLLKDSTEE